MAIDRRTTPQRADMFSKSWRRRTSGAASPHSSAGDRVHVTSVITSPATDPHDYEPTSADARTMAGAQLAIVNGIGYDPWADKLLAANPVKGRVVLNVGDLVGIKPGRQPAPLVFARRTCRR